MEYDYSRAAFIILIAMAVVFITIALIFTLQVIIYAEYTQPDGIDPRYVCIENDSFHQYPYNELCHEQKIQELMNKYYWLNSTE